MARKWYEEGEPKQRTDYHRPTRAIPDKKEKLSEKDYYAEIADLEDEYEDQPSDDAGVPG